MLSIAKALLFMDALDARNPERVIRFKLLLLDDLRMVYTQPLLARLVNYCEK